MMVLIEIYFTKTSPSFMFTTQFHRGFSIKYIDRVFDAEQPLPTTGRIIEGSDVQLECALDEPNSCKIRLCKQTVSNIAGGNHVLQRIIVPPYVVQRQCGYCGSWNHPAELCQFLE